MQLLAGRVKTIIPNYDGPMLVTGPPNIEKTVGLTIHRENDPNYKNDLVQEDDHIGSLRNRNSMISRSIFN